jgi:hypothetical protein
MKFHISKHANEESECRGIAPEILEAVLENPNQIVEEYEGKKAYQSKIDSGSKTFAWYFPLKSL